MGARTDKIKGKLKQVEGKLTGDRVRIAQGTVEKTKGDVESGAARVLRTLQSTARRVKAAITR